jgi:GMP synthase (glutamine-hydrolysing)
MQWIAKHLGGDVQAVPASREYGEAQLFPVGDPLFGGTALKQTVWMNHGDSVTTLPDGFKTIAYTGEKTISAMTIGVLWGVQFHPEVTHTVHGKTMLMNFMNIAKCEKDWEASSLVSSIQESVAMELGNEKAIFGFSGGVDSTTVAALLSPTLKDQIHAITIDGGNLREGEIDEIKVNAGLAGINLTVIDARAQFEAVMYDTIDAEEKRRRFRKVYAAEFLRAATECGATAVLQGTLATDMIESGATGGALIKTHHNVNLNLGGLRQLHPVSNLFKYEIRALAEEIGLPKSVFARQPFPGPGLFIRVIGVPATPERLDTVRFADARVREILERHAIYDTLSQLVVAYMGINTVGVKGSDRVYGHSIVVRAVETMDFMTARGIHFSDVIEEEICITLTRLPNIVRVWFDPTQKPPATTEME